MSEIDPDTESVIITSMPPGAQTLLVASERSDKRTKVFWAVKSSELPLHPHALRHTFARNLLKTGEGLEMVAEILGHKSLNTTRIYTQPSEQDKANAVEKLSYKA